MIRHAGAAPQISRRLADVLETLGLRRTATEGGSADATAREALAPARGAVLGTLLGAGCWAVVAVLAWTLAS